MTKLAVKQIVLASRSKGLPTREDFRVEEAPMPELPHGGLLLRVLYLSLDPYMRGRMDDRKSYAKPVSLGEVMGGESAGHVRHHGRGELVIQRSKASDDVRRTMIANALSAITQLPYGRLVKGEGTTVVLRDLVDECVAVAKADGVTLPGDVDAAVRKIAETAAGQYSSTAQDLARGKRSEIDHLNGFIVRRGEALGVATPANRLLRAIVRMIESKVADSSLPLEDVA